MTLLLTATVPLLATPCAMLVALGRQGRSRLVRSILATLSWIVRGIPPLLLLALGAALVLLVAMPLAFLVALCRQQRIPVLASLFRCYVELFRAVPALLVLYFAFYGLPRLGVALQPFQATALGMSLTSIA